MIECRKRRKDEVDEEKDSGRGVVGREGEKERKKKSEHILRKINKALSFTTLIHCLFALRCVWIMRSPGAAVVVKEHGQW